jgi:hypothetical protein
MTVRVPKNATDLYDVPTPVEGKYLAWGSNGTLVNADGAAPGTGGGSGGGVAIAAGGSTQTSGTVAFANSNGVTFSSGTQGVFATVATNYQSQGNYLTTAAQSNHTHSQYQATGNYLTTAAQSDHAHTQYQAAGPYLTTAMGTSERANYFAVSNNTFANATHTHGNPTLALTNLSGTTASGSNGLTLSLSAALGGGAGDGGNVFAAAGSTANSTGTVLFSNANGVSFGLTGGTITATVATNYQSQGAYLTTAANSTHTHPYQSSNANYLTNQTVQPVAYAAAGTTNNFSTLGFVNTNGVSWSTGTGGIQATVATNYQSQGAYLTTAMGTSERANYFATAANTFANSTHLHGGITLNLTNLSASSTSASNGLTLNLSAAAAGGGGALTISANNGSYVSGVLNFPATLGHTWSTDTNGVYLASDADPWGYTALTYQNRQLGASSHSVVGQSSIWMAPMRIGAPVSASTMLMMASHTGSVVTNATQTVAYGVRVALYKQNSTAASQFDSIWSDSRGLTVWNSGAASASFNYGGTTGSSAGSGILANSVFGLRAHTFAIGSVLDTGLYAYGYAVSSSSTGGSSVFRSWNPVMDNPLPAAMGYMGAATNNSIGYVDAGVLNFSSAAMPASFHLTGITQTANAVPYVKIGAI